MRAGALRRAAIRSIVIAFAIFGPFVALDAYEFWHVPPGEGYLNSDQTEVVPPERKWPVYLRDLTFVSAEFVAAVGFLFAIQALFARLPR